MNDDDIWGWSNSYVNRNGRVYKDDITKEIMKFLQESDKSKYYQQYNAVWEFEPEPEPTIEDKVVDIVKGGFEEKFGMTIQEFQEVYEQIVETDPERLI